MEIKRFFIENRSIKVGETINISGEEYRHAIKVSRYKVGYSLILSNGDGNDYYAKITEIDKDSFACIVESSRKNENELKKPLALYLCAIERNDLAVQKATEIGATEIHLMISRFTNAVNQNLDRLKRIASESAKQCGRAVVPTIFAPISYEEGIEDALSRFEQTIFCYEFARGHRIGDVFNPDASSYALIVGSEGGFAEEEVELARSQGARVVTLGRRILRAETACIAGLVLIADTMEKYENCCN
ncbi:MAG: 16S rRNA (uracil(1498)-N(3))-methyltransferase [Clostridia bacterium]|nr:16S rRNA (uracil(1498)-N(3))-methyltransferase [Clostridia bacterium]